MRLLIGRMVVCAVVLAPTSSWAAQRAFVKSTGVDTNPCTLQAPCRFFAAAIAAVDPGGEVVALDSAGYNDFDVNKAVSIVAPHGTYAGVTTARSSAVTINAGANDVVVLRGLTFKNNGVARGVILASGKALHVENCDFTGFYNAAVRIETGADLYVADTTIRNTGYNAIEGVGGGSAKANLFVDRTRIEGSGGCAFVTYDGTKATITDSHAVNGAYGFCTQSGSGTSELDIHGGSATDTANTGVGCSGNGSILRIMDALVTGNLTGFVQSNGCTFESLGNNLVRGNTNNSLGTITKVNGL